MNNILKAIKVSWPVWLVVLSYFVGSLLSGYWVLLSLLPMIFVTCLPCSKSIEDVEKLNIKRLESAEKEKAKIISRRSLNKLDKFLIERRSKPINPNKFTLRLSRLAEPPWLKISLNRVNRAILSTIYIISTNLTFILLMMTAAYVHISEISTINPIDRIFGGDILFLISVLSILSVYSKVKGVDITGGLSFILSFHALILFTGANGVQSFTYLSIVYMVAAGFVVSLFARVFYHFKTVMPEEMANSFENDLARCLRKTSFVASVFVSSIIIQVGLNSMHMNGVSQISNDRGLSSMPYQSTTKNSPFVDIVDYKVCELNYLNVDQEIGNQEFTPKGELTLATYYVEQIMSGESKWKKLLEYLPAALSLPPLQKNIYLDDLRLATTKELRLEKLEVSEPKDIDIALKIIDRLKEDHRDGYSSLIIDNGVLENWKEKFSQEGAMPVDAYYSLSLLSVIAKMDEFKSDFTNIPIDVDSNLYLETEMNAVISGSNGFKWRLEELVNFINHKDEIHQIIDKNIEYKSSEYCGLALIDKRLKAIF
ncbi:hypothetical protein DZF79_05740 [Vibrio parahaemolyticus]|nr:hypothetical protein [Vibrio parahaemolyticus]